MAAKPPYLSRSRRDLDSGQDRSANRTHEPSLPGDFAARKILAMVTSKAVPACQYSSGDVCIDV